MSKLERLQHANDLIRAIGQHGRRFFYSATYDRYARFELDARGRVWFVDDYSDKRVYTHRTSIAGRWRGFTHGGTLRSLVERMRDYITGASPIPIGCIAPKRSSDAGFDMWGYGDAACQAIQDTVRDMPIIENLQKNDAQRAKEPT